MLEKICDLKKYNMESIRKVKAIFILFCYVGIYACNTPSEKVKPNILYIFTDDQSFRTVSAYPESYEWVNTPNIDKLAEEGMRFSNCYTGTWCMASRASALTGLYPHSIRSLRMTGPYPENEYDAKVLRFWPSVFREAGYYTGIIGKWHTGSDDGAGRDWDYSAVWNHAVNGNGGYYHNQKISFNGKKPIEVGGYSTDNYTSYATDFIKKRANNKDQPWYLWLCYDAVHSPYTPADRHKGAYNDAKPVSVPSDIFPPRPGKPSHMFNYGVWKKNKDGQPTFGGTDFDDFVQNYNAGVLAIDEGVGKILELLKSTGQLDNTLVVFTSDQGFAIGQHGFNWKYAPYDANLKAPLLIRWPAEISPGQVCDHPVGGTDLVATFFAAAGISCPWPLQGHDISPMFKNPDCKWEYPLFLENTQQLFGEDTFTDDYPINKNIPCWISVRDDRYKYIRYLVEDEIEELYDLQLDPEELNNLSGSKEYKEMLLDYRQKAINELKRTNAGFVNKLPAVKTNIELKYR